MMKKYVITCMILVGTISSNAQNWGNNKRVRGNGKIVTETRNTSDYDGVSVAGSFDVVLVKGKEGKIILEGESNILQYIVTDVSNNVLKVSFEKNVNIRTTRKLIVTVPYKDIDKIVLGGSGNITSSETIKADEMALTLGGSGNIKMKLEANNVYTTIGGSGNIDVSGNTYDLTCSIAGSGSIKAYNLKTKNMQANIAGSGSIKTTVSDAIKAVVVGSGNIYYKGNPAKIDSKSMGSGNIIDKN